MTDYTIRFNSEGEAAKVAEQLPDTTLNGCEVTHLDKNALEVAIGIAGIISFTPLVGKDRYPYPVHEREYNGDNPRIYVRCLSAYTHNLLHGLWVDATKSVDEIWDNINWMLSYSPVACREVCEEWMIHDFEGFGEYYPSEFDTVETIQHLATTIKKHGEVFSAYLEAEYPCPARDIDDWNEVVEEFSTHFIGHFDSERDFALKSEEIDERYNFEAMEDQFPFWANHIDWDGVATDLFCSDYYSVRATDIGHGIYVFRNKQPND